ncbi:MAG TPA: hypothetical protein VGF30_07070 [Bacteroidia bacterium]
MPQPNFERMLQLAEDVFAVKNDPDQLDVDEHVIKHLISLHPSCVSEFADDNGPVVWILVIPTTYAIMNKFLQKEITEQQLCDLSQPGDTFETLYLCSAMVLPEYRSKGIAKRLSIEAIENIRKIHTIKALYVWPFSKEGNALSETIAKTVGLPLFKRA